MLHKLLSVAAVLGLCSRFRVPRYECIRLVRANERREYLECLHPSFSLFRHLFGD